MHAACDVGIQLNPSGSANLDAHDVHEKSSYSTDFGYIAAKRMIAHWRRT